MQTGGVDDDRLVLDSLWAGDANPSGDYQTMSAYQCLGGLAVHLDGDGPVTEFRRTLDLPTVGVTYARVGVRYRRPLFASHADDVIVLRLSADRPGRLTGTIARPTTGAAGPRAA